MATITDLKRVRYHKDRLNLFINKKFLCTVPDYVVQEYHLKKGVDVPPDVLEDIVYKSEKFRASESAYRLLTNRPHSRLELIQKLRQRGFGNDIIDPIIEKCEKEGYLDDRHFAKAWVKSRLSSKPRGRRKLYGELMQKGIDREVIDDILDQAFEETDEGDLALQLLEKHRSRFINQNSVDLKLKIRNFLSYRGFDYQAGRTAADKFIEQLEKEDKEIDEEFQDS